MNFNITSILDFWFADEAKSKWFNSTADFDNEIKTKYKAIWKHFVATKDNDEIGVDFKPCLKSADGCLALIILLDQLPLNMFRNQPEAFATEVQAVQVAKYALQQGYFDLISPVRIAFLVLPFMHSENVEDQNMSVMLAEKYCSEDTINFAKHHQNIITNYGRFPHRNAILNRESSQAEIDYLNSDEAFTG